jgi:hypothetical protein
MGKVDEGEKIGVVKPGSVKEAITGVGDLLESLVGGSKGVDVIAQLDKEEAERRKKKKQKGG